MAYPQPAFYPSITQEMRIRSQIRQPAQPYRPAAQQEWTTAAIAVAPRRSSISWQRILGIVGVCLLAALLLLILLLTTLAFGPLVNLVLVFLAMLPLLVIVGVVLLLDRWKPQSAVMVALCVLWGAAASVTMTLVIGAGTQLVLSVAGQDAPGDWFGAVIQAPLLEESSKGALLLVIFLAARKHFDGPLQGLIFGSLIGAGFAFTENILYFGSAFMEAGGAGLIMTFVMRAMLSPFLHTLFTASIGVIMGFGARKPGPGPGIGFFFLGLPVGMVLHGSWNAFASTELEFWPKLGLLVLLSSIGFSAWLTTALVLRRSEVVRTRQALGDYANAGWLTHAEVELLGSWAGRRRGRAWAARFPGAKPIMNRMIRNAATLAVLRHRILLNPHATHAERQNEIKLLDGFTRQRAELLRRTGG